MNSRWFAIVMVFMMSIVPFIGVSTSTPAESRDTGSAQSRDAKLVSWEAPVRLTTNSVNDTYPQLTVDSSGFSHIMYHQDNTSFKYMKVMSNGAVSIAETQILTANMSFQTASNQPSEVTAVDSTGKIHLVWKDGSTGQTNYQVFDNTGAPQILIMNPAANSYGPFIDIGTNNHIYMGTWIIPAGHAGQLTKIDTSQNVMMVQVQSGAFSVALVVDKWNGNDVHYLVKSFTESALYHSRWSSSLVQENASKRILPELVYPPLPAATTTPNGNVHLLYASSTSTPKTLSYVKLDANGTVLNGPVNFTTSAGDYGDIVGDGNNDVHIVWGNATDGNVYYRLIMDGKENTSFAAPATMVSTGLSGTSYYPQIDIATNNSPMMVFVNKGDGDDELYFVQGHLSFLKVNITEVEASKFAYLHPSETKVANWTLNYTSHIPDTLSVNVTIDYNGHEADGWNVSLDMDEVSVDPVTNNKYQVQIIGPSTGFMNDTIRVCINAQSKTRPALSDSTCFNATLNVTHSLKLDIPDNIKSVMSGKEVGFLAAIKNTGDTTVDVNVTIKDKPFEPWVVDVSPLSFEDMAPQEIRHLNLTVTTPKTAVVDEVGSITLKVFERDAPSVMDTAMAHVSCLGNFNISVVGKPTEANVLPGVPYYFNVSIKNDGTNVDPIWVNITFPEENGTWNVTAALNSVLLTKGQTQYIAISVVAPANAGAGTRHYVIVKAENETLNISARINLTAIVDRIDGLVITVTPPELEVEPGGTGEYTISIENTGNGLSDLTLLATEFPDNWSMYFPEVNVLSMPPGETKDIPVNVFVAEDAFAGNYTSKGTIFTNDHTFEYLFDMKTRVKEVYEINLTSPTTEGSAGVGETVIFRLNVSNLGNCQDSVTLSIPQDEIPSGWNYTLTLLDTQNADVPLTDGVVDLEQGQMAQIDLSISIPETGIIDSNFTIPVKATSLGLIQKEISLFVMIKRPNLMFVPVGVPGNYVFPEAKVGIPYVDSIPIGNDGDIACTHVNLSFYVDGELISSEIIERILPGTEVDFEFTWIPKTTGTHTLKFVIDPNNEIIETDETDNEDTMIKDVTKDKKSGGSSIPGFESSVLLVAISIAMLALALVRKRKK